VQASLLQAERHQAEADIKQPWYILSLALFGLWLAGCSASEESFDPKDASHDQEVDYITEPQSPDTTVVDTTKHGIQQEPKRKTPASQRFTVQADTLTAQSRKKEGAGASSVALRSSASKKYYSVQIGAFRLNSNIERNQQLLNKRFKQPVISFYENGIQLTRICVGNFSTKQSALAFLKKMKEQYPRDYTEAWVAELKK